MRNSELLDREKQAVYYLTLQATDGGGLSSSTMLHVYLLDINDNVPVVSGSYNIFVQEEKGNVSVTIQVRTSLDPVGSMGRAPNLALWSCWPWAGIGALLCGPEKVIQSLWACFLFGKRGQSYHLFPRSLGSNEILDVKCSAQSLA